MYKPDCGPPANYSGGVKSFHFCSLLYSTVDLNLNCSLVFLVKSFFSVLSSPERTKVPDTRQGSTLSQLRCRRSFEVTFVRDIY